MLGCSLDTTSYTVVCVPFLRFALPGKGPVYCIDSNVTSLCGVVHFATCLTGRVESSRFSVIFVIVGVRVVCVTADISSIIWVACNLVFVRHSVHLSFIRIFQTVKLYFPSELCHNLFILAVLQKQMAWFIDFFRCGGILAYMNCSMIAWASTPNAPFANFWSSSKKSINFWFGGLNTSCWNMCFAVAIDWGFTYFLRNTVRISPKFSLLGLFGDVFERLQRITTHERVEIVYFVFFC